MTIFVSGSGCAVVCVDAASFYALGGRLIPVFRIYFVGCSSRQKTTLRESKLVDSNEIVSPRRVFRCSLSEFKITIIDVHIILFLI